MADIAHVLHFQPSEMERMDIFELAEWWAQAARIAKPPES